MDRELAEIIERLEALKASADKLGAEQGRFIRHIEAAEAQLDAAKKDVEQSKAE